MQFGHTAQLVLCAQGQLVPDEGLLGPHPFQELRTLGVGEYADVDLGNRQVGGDGHLGDRDEGAVHAAVRGGALKDVGQVFLDDPTYFFLSLRFHRAKIRRIICKFEVRGYKYEVRRKKYEEMKKIEHLGIAVKDLEQSNALFAKLLGAAHYKTEEVASEGVNTSFFKVGPNKIELLEATREDSPIAKFIEKKGEGIHHIAFEVDDIKAEIARLKGEGFIVLNEEPKMGADNKWVAFLHPKTTNGVLIELCQERA